VHSQDAERASVSQADRLYLNIGLDLVAHQGRAPVQVLRAENHWLLVSPVLQNSYVQWLVQLEQHSWVEFYFFVVSDEFKHECLIKDGVTRNWHDLSGEAVLQEAHSH